MCYNKKVVNVNGRGVPLRAYRPTLKDIARLSGFSVGTVDRALHGRREINPQTRQKILEVARALGYQTNCVASVLSRKKPLVFAAIFPRELHYFYDDIRRGFQEAVQRFAPFKILPLFREVKGLGQGEEEVLETVLREEVSGVVFAPGHRSKFNRFIDRFAEKNVPVVTVSTDAPESKRLTAVYVDPYKNGELAGELMSHFLPPESKVAVMVGSLEIEDHRQKAQGFQKAVSLAQKGIHVVGVWENEENEELARYNFLKAMEQYPDLAGVYIATANSPAICRVIEEKKWNGRLKIVTTDLFQEMIPYLEKGVIHATIFQNPYRQGFEATMLLFRFLVEGVTPPLCHYLEPIVVMKSNLEFYFS